MIQQGAQQLLQMGLRDEKRIAFYNSTYNTSDHDLDPFKIITLVELANLDEKNFEDLIGQADNELQNLVFAV